MKKNYLQRNFAIGLLSFLFVGSINSQTTDLHRIWAKDANVMHDYYYWGATNKIQIMNSGTNFEIPAENGVTQGVNYAWNNCFLKFENIDFGTLSDSLTFVRNVPRGAIVEFWIDRNETTRFDSFFNAGSNVDESSPRNVTELSGGKFLGSYQHWYAEDGLWSRWENHKIAINPTGGIHNLYVLFRVGGKSGTTKTVGGLYYIDLHRSLESNVTLSVDEADKDITLTIGKHNLSYTVAPSSASSQLVWSVESGKDIVTVDNGAVIAMKAGVATVKCSLGSQTETYNITVVGTATASANRVEAETADTLYNTFRPENGQAFAKGILQESGNGNGLNYSWNTNFAVYKDVDFGNFTDSIKLRHSVIRGAAIEFWIDRNIVDETNSGRTGDYNNPSGKDLAGGTFLGRYEFLKDDTYTGGASTWQDFKLPIVPTSGKHTLYVVFLRGGKGLYNKTTGHWDWFELDRKIANIYQIVPSETAVIMKPGDTKTINLQTVPEIVYNSNVTWSVIQGSEYVSVDNTGQITANAIGTAKVRVTSNADSNVYADIDVTVDISTGISGSDLKLTYNNPVSNTLQVQSKSVIENVTIIDLSGRIVYNQNGVNHTGLNIDCSAWNVGLYFVQLKTASETRVLKIAKQ
ncbi:MAG: Ig-like domain-containing protein [Dysgonomonas sp.]